jgi:hypothetical protein
MVNKSLNLYFKISGKFVGISVLWNESGSNSQSVPLNSNKKKKKKTWQHWQCSVNQVQPVQTLIKKKLE